MMRICAIALAVFTLSCRSEESSAASTGGRLLFQDDFERADLGDAWRDTSGGAYSIVD